MKKHLLGFVLGLSLLCTGLAFGQSSPVGNGGPLTSAPTLNVTGKVYDVRNYGWPWPTSGTCGACYTALLSALTAANATGGCVYIPPTATDPVLTGDVEVYSGTGLCGNGFPSEFQLHGQMKFDTDSWTDNVSMLFAGNGSCSDYGVLYGVQSTFYRTRFATFGCSSTTLVRPNTPNRNFDWFIGDTFAVEASSLSSVTLLQVEGSYDVVNNNLCLDTNSGNSTQCMIVEGTSGFPQNNDAIVGNVEQGAGITVGDLIESVSAPGNLENLVYASNSDTVAPTLTNLDATAGVALNAPSPNSWPLTQTFSGLALSSTGGTTITNAATGSVASLIFNSNAGSAPTGDLLDLQLGGSTLLAFTNSGGLTASGLATFNGSAAIQANVPVQVQQSPTASPSPCPGPTFSASTPAPTAEMCFGPIANPFAVLIGKQLGTEWGGTTTANSAELGFVSNNGTLDRTANISYSSGGVMTFVVNGSYSFNAPATVAGALQAACLCNSTTTKSAVPPVYTSAGAAVATTFHGAEFTCTFASSTTCTPSAWTNAAVFASSTSIEACNFSTTTASGISFTCEQTATNQITITASASNSLTVNGVAWGT